ncbi:four helix bundle protein [Flavobacterium gossypii]|uniref:Four helix bundle protein n=1 Tax=Flavobacterium gossypii TaxID=1646119 RepID=A0ABR6DNN4_9FLAO|nr:MULTISPECIES: four helix bundle protein [Flavobacterium]MBA9073305.1 four helix bundle protein [Flavobacterium gossypii]WDO13767.1 four helix bundle protein [Flavobacterium sp. WW92]
MGKFNSFEEINSWQKSRIFNKKVYLITENESFKKDFDLARQIRRASVSISSNIAEGFERNTDKEFIYFLYVAKASAGEVRSQLYLALDLNYITKQDFEELLFEITEISKLLSGFIKYLSGKL